MSYIINDFSLSRFRQSIRENSYHHTIRKVHVPIMGAFAEFEQDLIIERTTDGLVSARARGRVGGRPKGLFPAA